MPVSAGLQKYFDARRSGKGDDTRTRLDAISGQLDPAFSQSFADFKTRILGIIDDNPDEIQLVQDELEALGTKIQVSKRQHNLQKAKAIIDTSERV